jgi:CHAT domain-containing protein/Tfp pilus assembly protein PilF
MARFRQHRPARVVTAEVAPRLRPSPRTLIAALAVVLALFSHAGARQDGDCTAPDALAARAENLSTQWKLSALREALDGFERARACWGRAGLRREEAGALKRIGDIKLSLSEYAQAIDAYGASLTELREAGDRQAESRALVDLGRAMLFTLRLDEALQNAQEAASIARTLGDRGLEASAENVIGKYYYRRGDYQQAAEHYALALPLARAAGDLAEEAQALYNAGQLHGDVGELPEALAHYQRALPLWRAANRRQGEVRTLTSMGLTYSLMGESQTALEYLDGMALPSLREAGDRMGEAAAHNNIGYVYQSLGDDETALSHYRDALVIFDQIKMVAGQAVTSVYIGDVSASLGRAREAQENYERGLALSRALGNPLLEAEVLNSMGSLRLSAGKAEEAYELFRQALSAYEKGEYLRGQAAALNNIGWYFGGRGDWRTAAGHFRRALEFCRAAGDRLGESLTLYNLARSDLELGDAATARENVEAGLRLTESLRTKIASGDLRASYFATAHRQFELYIAVLMKLYGRDHDSGLAAAAFEASERGRARSLLETLAETHADIRRGVDPALLLRERELQSRLDAKAERRVQLLGARAAAKEVAEVERQMDDLTGEYRRVQGQIRASSPLYAALVQPAPLTLGETQKKVLDADTVLLEYALGEQRSFVWAVTPDSIKSFELPARAEVETAARRVYELLTARNRQVKGETGQQWQARIRQADAAYEDASAALGRMLLNPVAAELGHKRLVVVADGALQYVPFAALPAPVETAGEKTRVEDAGTRRAGKPSSNDTPPNPRAGFIPLIAEHEVVSLPSASVLALTREEMQSRRPAPKSVAVLADPVFDGNDERLALAKGSGAGRRSGPDHAAGTVESEMSAAGVARKALRSFDGLDEGTGIARLLFSQREARTIMASVPTGDGMLALGFHASRATARSPELSQYRIVHFATHGLLNSEHPELSGIILSLFDETGRRQDGFLELNEIYNLNLPADLVVLSACQTALGKDVRGEGLVGLTRGFMYAGARRVVASLWKVDDSATAELMGEFYREMLGKGLRPAEALRAAQRHMWQQPRWRSPYFWAAFTLQGEWR